MHRGDRRPALCQVLMRTAVLLPALLLCAPRAAADAVVHVPAEAATIQLGIDAVDPGGVVIVAAGLYNELIDFHGKALTLTSVDPDDPLVVAGTVVTGAGLDGPVVRCVSGEGDDTVLTGLTITGGNGLVSPAMEPRGGGMRCVGSSPTVTRCVFEGNQVGPYNGWVQGGGMYIEGGNPRISHCVFRSNAALAIGGPVKLPAGTGGGLAIFNGAATVASCIFVGNRAGGGSFDGGGGLYVKSSAPGVDVVNCTIAGNDLESFFASGGGLLGDARVANVVAWGNAGAEIVSLPGPPAVVTYSDIEAGFVGVGNIAADPLFVRDPNPGGDLEWGTADDDHGDLHLSPGSPAIDAGDNLAVPAFLLTDLDGAPRLQDDPATADTGNGTSPLVDMGAYEGPSLCGAELASATPYGTGKPGTNGIPVLSTTSLPIPGETADLTITDGLPNSTPATQPLVLFIGVRETNIPFDGGTLLAGADLVLFLPIGLDGDGDATLSGPVPFDASLCGLAVFFQVMIAGDPGATGFHQTAQTNGMRWVFGGE